MSLSIPQICPLPESVVEGPAFKKQGIEVNDESDTRPLVETALRIEAEEDIPARMDSSSVGGATPISKAKKPKKQRKDPPRDASPATYGSQSYCGTKIIKFGSCFRYSFRSPFCASARC
jgi:hypothetical protein